MTSGRSTPRVYVVIPAYNEAEHLDSLLPRIPRRVLGRPLGVIVVCDGSTDGTCGTAEARGAEVVKLWPNSGKGAAVRVGAALIRDREFDAVVTMDGDGQHKPAELAALLRPVLTGRCDVTIGSRYMAQPERGPTPLNRYVVRALFTRLLRSRLAQPVTDPFSGYRCMTKKAFDSILLSGDRYEGELEVRFEAERLGFDVAEIPIKRIYGEGQSKMRATGGRLKVIKGYFATVVAKTRELESSRRQVPVG